VNLETRKSSRLATGSPVSAVALSPVRRQVAVARDTGLVELRNIDDGQLVSTWALSTPARSLAFSQDGYLLASVGLDNVVTLSQVVPGRGILTIAPGHELLAIRFGAGDQLVGYFRTERGLSARGLNGVKPA
jgi:WD40 repeat protein